MTEPERQHLLEQGAMLCGRLAVVMLGLSSGAMLTGAMVLVPFWQAMSPEAFISWFGVNSHRMALFFGPLQVIGIVLATVSAALCHWLALPGRVLFTTAVVLAIATLATYVLFFQQTSQSFLHGTLNERDVVVALEQWRAWQWVRVSFGVAAFVAATVALGRTPAVIRAA